MRPRIPRPRREDEHQPAPDKGKRRKKTRQVRPDRQDRQLEHAALWAFVGRRFG